MDARELARGGSRLNRSRRRLDARRRRPPWVAAAMRDLGEYGDWGASETRREILARSGSVGGSRAPPYMVHVDSVHVHVTRAPFFFFACGEPLLTFISSHCVSRVRFSFRVQQSQRVDDRTPRSAPSRRPHPVPFLFFF